MKAHHKQKVKKKAASKSEFLQDCNDTFAFIAGYTSGGAPYGLTWEEMGIDSMLPLEEKVKLYRSDESPQNTYDDFPVDELPFD